MQRLNARDVLGVGAVFCDLLTRSLHIVVEEESGREFPHLICITCECESDSGCCNKPDCYHCDPEMKS